MTNPNTLEQQAMIDLFQQHVNAELQGDLATTMATMSENPHLLHVPSLMGGFGYEGVKSFYANHLVGKFFPKDVKMEQLSQTVGNQQIVDELAISFTHDQIIDWLLPNVQPTGKFVEIIVIVIVGINNGKITHEHIYWDQASVLAQIGLINPEGLPITGAEASQKIRQTFKP